ncbi:MAG: recombination protein RecR [Planctomyces sp.]|nr:recombination protein RecR [Planctomyces sp.]MBA4039609.1 recombination protein RecR [Planctomyces sp.]MBA4120652.1 recombination protein RecR [Isosphaera sp.]
MGGYPGAVEDLIDRIARLPGIGPRSAERLALHLLREPPGTAEGLAAALRAIKRAVRNCAVCYNLTEGALCAVCGDDRRDRAVVLAVEQPRDVLALEQTGVYTGVYHVLLGRVAPLEGVGPGDLTIAALVGRVRDPALNCAGVAVREVVLGTSPTLEGDGTALVLAEAVGRVAPGVRVTRLARGLPTGSALELASKAVLADAITERRDLR